MTPYRACDLLNPDHAAFPCFRVAELTKKLEPISKLPTAVDRIRMSNDSAQGRAVGAHPGSFSGGEYCRWTSWAQTDSGPLCARSGTVRSVPVAVEIGRQASIASGY